MKAWRAGLICGFCFMGLMLISNEFFLLPVMGLSDTKPLDWRMNGYLIQGVGFGFCIGLATYFIRRNVASRFPASAADPEHLVVSRAAWEAFQYNPTFFLNHRLVVFRPEGDRWVGRLGLDFWFDWSSRLMLKPVYQSDDTVVLSVKLDSRNLIGMPLYGYEIKVHQKLAALFSEDAAAKAPAA